jgi:hypothetical protein
MEAGKKYRIRYQIPGVYNRPREMVAKFLSVNVNEHTGAETYVFSGRPEFGTTDLEAKHIRGVWELRDQSTQCYHGRKFDDDTRVL